MVATFLVDGPSVAHPPAPLCRESHRTAPEGRHKAWSAALFGKGRKGVRVKRFVSIIGTCAIALVAPVLTGAIIAASATTTSGSVTSASTKTSDVTAATSKAQTITATGTQTTTTIAAKTTVTTTPTGVLATSATTTGNGAPSGSHYNLNIIGVPKDKTADMNNNDGHRIFVQLNGGSAVGDITGKNFTDISKVNTILLAPAPAGSSFQVLDANATDKNGAVFQLPPDVSTTWTVWARALGKPGGKADMTTCATATVIDPLTGLTTQEVVCSIATLKLERTKNAKFQNVTSDLLTLTLSAADATLAGCTSTTVGLFDPCLQNFFWNYDNNGLKLLQLRFYAA